VAVAEAALTKTQKRRQRLAVTIMAGFGPHAAGFLGAIEDDQDRLIGAKIYAKSAVLWADVLIEELSK
jgi:hypothetical protein